MKRCKNCGRYITEQYGDDNGEGRCVWCRNGYDLTEVDPCEHPITPIQRGTGNRRCAVCGVEVRP